MKQLILATALAASVAAPAAALAQAPQTPGPASPHTLSYNVGFFSNYIFRGISQTGGKPALQGGADYGHASGFYAGTWASNVSWLQDFGAYTRSSLEWDFYGGYKWSFANDFGLDVGSIYYWFPGSKGGVNNPAGTSANTWEIYVAGTWKFLGAKFSYSLTDYFGAKPTGQDTDGTWYLDLFANYPFGDSGFALNAHYGILDVRKDGSGNNEVSYDDWRIGGSYTFPSGPVKGLEVGAYYSDTNASNFYVTPAGYNTGKGVLVAYVKKTF